MSRPYYDHFTAWQQENQERDDPSPAQLPNPEHEDNRRSREFLDGYAEGLTSERGVDSIANEWRARGCPEELPAGSCEWKRGFNAGS